MYPKSNSGQRRTKNANIGSTITGKASQLPSEASPAPINENKEENKYWVIKGLHYTLLRVYHNGKTVFKNVLTRSQKKKYFEKSLKIFYDLKYVESDNIPNCHNESEWNSIKTQMIEQASSINSAWYRIHNRDLIMWNDKDGHLYIGKVHILKNRETKDNCVCIRTITMC